MSQTAKGKEPQERHRWESMEGDDFEGRRAIRELDPAVLLDFVAHVVEDGDACLFGSSSDGGALAVSILSQGKTHRAWFHTVKALQDRLGQYVRAS